MGFLARLFGGVPKEEQDGICLDAPGWELSATRDVERFLRALPLLAPEGAVAYFEGTGESHVTDYLTHIAMPAQTKVAVGIIWPKPDFYHVAVTVSAMEDLARFLEQNPTGYFCSHCHVYRDGVILLGWHDAFSDPIYLSRTISENTVKTFAAAIGASYSQEPGD